MAREEMIQLLSKNISFPNLLEISIFDNKISDAGLGAIASNGSKFPNLISLTLCKS